MSHRPRPAALVALALLAACAGENSTPVPTENGPASLRASLSVSAETQALEPVARRLALALNDPAFRRRFHDRLAHSPIREGKLHLQRTLHADGGRELQAVARLNRETETSADAVFTGAQPLEVYLPVPAHRRQWGGDGHLLVATQAHDHELIVAYDLSGGRHLLDPTRPPQTPVLAVVPVETNFDAPGGVTGQQTSCGPTGSCGGGGGGGGSPPPPVIQPGLYMTRAHFVQDFEGWLKGSPEFEIHIMGQLGATDSLTRLECAGEHQLAPYNWDGDTDWNGSVMLFSSSEIAAYKSAHPGQTFRIVAMEDDDTSCEMRIDNNRWAQFLGTITPLYRDVTGAIDTGSVKKYVAAGRSFLDFLSKLASWFKSNDDLIGNAIEDKVTGEFHAGYNWDLKADNNVTNGWINLEMK